ncbi:uncharacterized protein LOC143259233 [Megalopta genalis]|uniref:uncharacterized protein LOC143259233 n=1 Tax=Megalopta genalis TaxID=115081 RepID=UPI003FD13518
MASFWFLDTMAHQVLKNKENLDDYCLGVLVSWLAGEMMLIREKKLPREEFFRLMKKIFQAAGNKIPDKNRCPYWDEVVAKQPEESLFEATQSDVDKKESASEDGRDETETFLSNVDPVVVLDTVMESTYAMYANELRYTLVYEVFAEPITVHSYQVPFSIRKPRSAKLTDLKTTPFNVGLRRTFELHDVFGIQKKKTGKGKLAVTMVHTPANSLDDEEDLAEKRKFILPLIEANEAMALFDQPEENDDVK